MSQNSVMHFQHLSFIKVMLCLSSQLTIIWKISDILNKESVVKLSFVMLENEQIGGGSWLLLTTSQLLKVRSWREVMVVACRTVNVSGLLKMGSSHVEARHPKLFASFAQLLLAILLSTT